MKQMAYCMQQVRAYTILLYVLLYATGSCLHYVPDRVGPRMETLPVLLLLPSVTYQLSRLI